MLALVLSAGMGTRLKPLTLKVPKPLLEIDSVPLIAFPLFNLRKNGIKNVIINLFWMGEMIKDVLGSGHHLGLNIKYIKEKELMGTGGTIKHVFNTTGCDKLLVLNADTICDVSLKALEIGRANAVLVLTNWSEEYTPVWSDGKKVVRIGSDRPEGAHPFTFCGIHVLSKNLAQVINGRCMIENGYKEALRRGMTIKSFTYNGFFTDVGTLKTLRKLRQNPKIIPQFDEVKKWFLDL